MRKTKTSKTTKATKTTKSAKTAKTKRGSPVGGRVRNADDDRALSFDPPTKDEMPKKADKPADKQAKRSPKPAPGQRVRESVDRVMAECDKVDAALFEMARATQVEDMPLRDVPPLTIKEIDTADGEGGTTRSFAVVSADPQRPLTEVQAKQIIAAIQSHGTLAAFGIAAE